MSDISEHGMSVGDNHDAYVGGTGDGDTDEVRIAFVGSTISASCDFSPDEIIRFRSVLDNAIKELFAQHPGIRCPACGYTAMDADFHLDHKLCRRYPFFPGETGETEAVNR